jgi:hypothetical protein
MAGENWLNDAVDEAQEIADLQRQLDENEAKLAEVKKQELRDAGLKARYEAGDSPGSAAVGTEAELDREIQRLNALSESQPNTTDGIARQSDLGKAVAELEQSRQFVKLHDDEVRKLHSDYKGTPDVELGLGVVEPGQAGKVELLEESLRKAEREGGGEWVHDERGSRIVYKGSIGSEYPDGRPPSEVRRLQKELIAARLEAETVETEVIRRNTRDKLNGLVQSQAERMVAETYELGDKAVAEQLGLDKDDVGRLVVGNPQADRYGLKMALLQTPYKDRSDYDERLAQAVEFLSKKYGNFDRSVGWTHKYSQDAGTDPDYTEYHRQQAAKEAWAQEGLTGKSKPRTEPREQPAPPVKRTAREMRDAQIAAWESTKKHFD